ncbi:hypothetical protein L6R52_00960 [Myxococcota bacterium]|nr:hypothetical protein [Myxococcota bacterium]
MAILRKPVLWASVASALAILSQGTGCSTPGVQEYEPRTGLITGTVFYPGGTARGNVVVVLFRADNPPPPQGTGSPVNLVIVPEAAIFKGVPEGATGDFAAPYTIPSVAAGTYQIRAFLDADGDFNPAYPLLAQPSAGDVGGGHVDLDTFAFLPVEVAVDRVTPQVNVTLGREYPVERPAFEITSTASIAVPLAAPARMTLKSRPIRRGPLQMDPRRTAFLVQYADLNGDGAIDDANGDHLPDLFPRVILRRVNEDATAPTIIVPGIIDPFPYRDTLAAAGAAVTTELNVIIPPVAVERSATGDRILSEIPPGDYDTILISGTGQTWQVPNELDRVFPIGTSTATPEPSQSVRMRMVAGPALPAGRIEGTVQVASNYTGDAYVIAFDATNPPPPVGTGRPVALATVPASAFSIIAGGSAREASFALTGLRNGSFLVRGFVDVERNFSPLVDLVAQPSARDVGGAADPAVVTIASGSTATVRVVLDTPVLFDRPTFRFEQMELSRTSFPARLVIESHAVPALGTTLESAQLPIALGSGDADGDNLRDLLPRVLLTRITDGGDPRTAPDDPEGIIIPGIVDPLAYLAPLASGVPAIPASSLSVILPPAAVKLGPGGTRTLLSPPPAGRYRVNVLSATGQTWSVPSTLDVALARIGTPLEDPTQATYVNVTEAALPGGSISGMVQLLVPAPEGDFSVVVLAFDRNRPPPPLGSARPVASAIVGKAAFSGGAMASYTLAGLATGTYHVRAYLDADDDFVPWFDTMNQPDRGDVGGGHLGAAGLADVAVDALAGAVTGKDVQIVPPLAFTTDRPAFYFQDPASPVLDLSGGPVSVLLRTLESQNDVLRQFGVFSAQWLDLDADGIADDRNADGVPEVFPIVIAQLLDPDDPTGARLASPEVRVPGIVSPLQFADRGFPLGDPTAVSTVVTTSTLTVVFPPIGLDEASNRVTPPAGRYRVTVINARGQTWSIPNELQRAAGTPLPSTQSTALVVEP